MRLAFLVESTDLGGGERVVSHLMKSAMNAGHVVQLIVPETQSAGWLCRFAESQGIAVHSLTVSTLRVPLAILNLTRLLQRERIDLVNAHMALMAFIGTLSSRLAGIPCVITLHNGDERWSILKRTLPLAIAVRLASKTIAVSSAMAREIESRLRLPSDGVDVIPNGSPQHKVIGGSCTKHDGVSILMAGTCTKNKNHALLVFALDLIRTKRSINVTIAGRLGDGSDELISAVRSSRYRDSIRIVGHLDSLNEEFTRADLFVLCSHREGMPMVVVEAMLAGLPVICSRVGGVPEIIEHGLTGLLFEPGSVTELALEVERCLESEHLRHSLGASGQEFASSRLTVQRMWESYQSVFSRTVASATLFVVFS